ncbi:MAG TPA: hypothetical protein VK654_16145 [Nitrospirota bacterium]|nr:hypothetical protein [Nitrospirota bacterium]
MKLRKTVIAMISAYLAILTGCGYVGFFTSQAHWHKTFDTFPSMSALNKIDPEDSLLLHGSIVRSQPFREPLLVVAVSDRFEKNEKVAMTQLTESATVYWTFLPRGEYTLYVFADLDKDGTFQTEECIGQAQAFVTHERSEGGIVVEGPRIIADVEHPLSTKIRVRERVRPASYMYDSLDDEFFNPRYGSLGLYQPSEFIAHTQRFLFSLGRFERGKTVVLFVHGIAGTPRDWKYMADGLDRRRFQPFFFYYPSGLRLDKLGTLLAEAIISLYRNAGGGDTQIVLAAYSMGGLVALSAIQKLAEKDSSHLLKLYCSFSTPYLGDESAKKWISSAPVVVPAWNDIAADSEFLNSLAAKPYPKNPPFHLFFSYYDKATIRFGESTDGTVSLRSQLDTPLQKAAVRIYGFHETHDSILNSAAVRSAFFHLLAATVPNAESAAQAERPPAGAGGSP